MFELLVRNVSLSEENVHVTGHTACNGVNGEVDFASVVHENVRELLNGVLSLSDSHSVTGDDDNVLCSLKDEISILDGHGLGFLVLASCCSGLLFRRLEKESSESLVHSFAHDECEDDA